MEQIGGYNSKTVSIILLYKESNNRYLVNYLDKTKQPSTWQLQTIADIDRNTIIFNYVCAIANDLGVRLERKNYL